MPFRDLLFRLGVFALLVRNAAAGLAGRLAGGLALSTAAVLSAVTEVSGLQGDNMFQFHHMNLHQNLSFLYHKLYLKSSSVFVIEIIRFSIVSMYISAAYCVKIFSNYGT